MEGRNDYRSKQAINVNQPFHELSGSIQEHAAVICQLSCGDAFCEVAYTLCTYEHEVCTPNFSAMAQM
jgi:hypothetical protein